MSLARSQFGNSRSEQRQAKNCCVEALTEEPRVHVLSGPPARTISAGIC